jgi:hypothetical protein
MDTIEDLTTHIDDIRRNAPNLRWYQKVKITFQAIWLIIDDLMAYFRVRSCCYYINHLSKKDLDKAKELFTVIEVARRKVKSNKELNGLWK